MKAKKQEQVSYSNDLHDALLSKNSNEFWKSQRNKFGGNRVYPNQVDDTTDEKEIVSKFADYFRTRCSANCAIRGTKLTNDYENMRRDYKGSSGGEAQSIDAELIDSVISKCKKNKAAGLDTLTAEHLQYSHPALATIFAELFNITIING